MKYFILGVICTLAVIYPASTKRLLGVAVDTAHNVTTSVMESSGKQ